MKTTKEKVGTIICKNSSFLSCSWGDQQPWLTLPNPWGLPPAAQGPISAPRGHQSLPQRCCSSASLQLPTAQQDNSLVWPQPFPRGVPKAGGCNCPPAALLLARAAGQALATSPCLIASRGDPAGWVLREQPPALTVRQCLSAPGVSNYCTCPRKDKVARQMCFYQL